MSEKAERSERYFRIVLLADPAWGEGSLSWRVKKVLEDQGHTVFFFSPKTHAFAFEEDAASGVGKEVGEGAGPGDTWRARTSAFKRFLENQNPDVVILADGVTADARDLRDLAACAAVGCLCESAGQVHVARRVATASAQGLDFTWVVGERAQRCAEGFAELGRVRRLTALVDRSFANTPLANTIVFAPGVLCVQDATEGRVEALRELASRPDMQGLPVRCFGAGWPREWTCEGRFSELVYAAKSSRVVVRFQDEEGLDEAPDAPVALALASGARLMEQEEGAPVLNEASAHEQVRFLDDDIRAHLEEARASLESAGKMPGSSEPRTIACILGYFGMGNFGDEYILATLDKRLRARVRGLSVVAVSENPQHTLERRGIFALSLKRQRAVDVALAHSSVALVVAGLLFDQGIRWTMGKAELFSSLRYSTIPGIAGYVALAHMNGAKPVMYGIGAGPLDVGDSRKLVKLMGELGAVFLARDEATAQLIRSCGVPADQAIRKADTAFLGYRERVPLVDEWLEREIGATSPEDAKVQLLAVSLRNYENIPADFDARVAAALDAAMARYPRVRVAFCALDPDDRHLAQRIMDRMASLQRVHLFDAGDDIGAVCDLLSRCYAGFSMRYHCSLILNSCGKPCIGMDYLPKVTSLYQEMGCADLLVGTQATSEEMEAKLALLLDDYARWAQVVDQGARSLREMSEQAESMLLGWIGECSQGKFFGVPEEFYLHDRPECELRLGDVQREADDLRVRVGALEGEARQLRSELDAVRGSHSFRAGLALTAPARALRRLLRK